MSKIYLVALRESPQRQVDRAVPKVVSIESNNVVDIIALVDNTTGSVDSIVKVKKNRFVKNYKVAENIGEYWLQTDFTNAASSPYNTGTSANVAGAGSVQSTATAITAYFNSVTAACAVSTFGVKLPNASTTGSIGRPIFVKNASSTNVYVYPAASEFLNGSSTVAATIKTGQFGAFYCSSSTSWVKCKGPYY